MNRLYLALTLAIAAVAAADTYTWTGATSTDFSVAGNWTTNGVVAESTPCDNDDVIIDAGTAGITAGLDQSACDFNSFVVGPNFDYSVGNSTTDELRFAADLVVIAGGGDGHWLKAESPGWDEVIIKSVGPNGTDDIYLDGSTCTTLNIKKGTVELETGLAITTLVIDPTNGTAANVNVTSAATVTTLFHRTGAFTQTGGTVTTHYMDAGTFTATAGTTTNLVQRGGTTTWKTTATMTDAKVFAGTFDASQDVRPKTITSLQAHFGATINLDNSVGNITITNGVRQYAGTVAYPTGSIVEY
jgi:hypothetical protein